jgi:hypothetical protein
MDGPVVNIAVRKYAIHFHNMCHKKIIGIIISDVVESDQKSKQPDTSY